MRISSFLLVAVVLLAPGRARAQDTGGQPGAATPPSLEFTNRFDFGWRGTSFDDNADEARFGRYRDMRDGGFLDRVRFTRETDRWLFGAEADHVGYRDERFSAAYNEYGKVKATFEWNQTPLFYSQDTSWLWDTEFERLRNRRVIAAGERSADLAVRLRYAEVDFEVSDAALTDLLEGFDEPEVDVLANYTVFADFVRAVGAGT